MKKILAIFLMLFCVVTVYATDTGNTTKPTTPVLSVDLDVPTSKVTLSWTESDIVSYYEVYRSTQPTTDFELINTIPVGSPTCFEYRTEGTYYYKVIPVLSYPDSVIYGDESNVVSVTIQAMRPPLQPGITVTKGDNNSLVISWDNDTTAKGYYVYRSTSKNNIDTRIATVTDATSYTDENLTPGTTYYYVVIAYNGYGWSEESNVASATVAKLAAPTLTVVKEGDSTFVLSWTAVEGAESYYIQRSLSKKTGYSKISNTNMLTYTETGIPKGMTYYYQVVAKNSYDESVASNTVELTVEREKMKGAPVASIAKGNNNRLVISWDAVDLADGYYVYSATSKNGKYKKIATVTGTSYTNKKLTYGKTYYYKVVAYNSYEKTGYSNIVSMKVLPNKVEGLKVSTYGSTSVKLSWDELANTGYALYVSTDNKTWTRVTRTTSEKYTHSGLKSNRTYYYKVRAYHTVSGTRIYGAYSDVVEIRTAPGKTKLTVSTTINETLNVNFTEVSGATSYYIYRATSKNGTYKYITQVPEAGTYNDTDVVVGKTYYYKIRVRNEEYSFGSYTSYVSKTVVPARVTDFSVASVGSTSIKLAWEEVDGSGYEIYRSTNNKKWTKIKTITKDTTETYKNTKLTANKNYYYKIRAYKTVKGKKVYSWFTPVIKIKTAPKTPTLTVTTKDYTSLNVNVYESKGAVKYEIYKYAPETKTYELLTELTKPGTYVDTNLTTGETYYYKVRAINSDGNASSYTSVISKKVVPATPKLSLSTTKKQVKITLSDVEGIDGYEIYRATSKKGKYTKIADLAELEFVNSTKKGRYYYYKVRAYTMVGDTKVYSSYSSIKYIKSK